MKVEFIGRKKMDFTAQDGNHIEGLRLYVTHPAKGVDGIVAEQLFCNVNRPEYEALEGCKLPCSMEVEFNRYGRPAQFEIGGK